MKFAQNRIEIFFALTLITTLAACGSEKKQDTPKPAVATSNATVSVHTQLVNAVHNYEKLTVDSRLKLVTSLLGKGANPNTKNELDEPILGDAVHFGDGKSDDIRVVKLLVDSGADVNAVGSTHRSPLTKAAENGKLDVLDLFFLNKLEINNENGTRALVKAAYLQHRDVVELFLAHGFKASGKYAEALQADGMKSEETKATAALFGAYVDILKEELMPLLRSNRGENHSAFLTGQLNRIEASCKTINSSDAIEGNMSDYFNRPEECSTMGRLGSLAYKQCYGLMRSNSANLQMLQNQINDGAMTARAPLQFENVKFSEITNPQELIGYDNNIRAAMAMYQDMLLPRLQQVGGRMAHHSSRNHELQDQARKCGNQAILGGASQISGSINAISADQRKQMEGFEGEVAVLEKMRAKIAYQLPALNSTEVLQQREEDARKKQEEDKKNKDKPRS